MTARTPATAAPFVPDRYGDLDELRQAARNCHGSGLFYQDATQTVFGEGGPHARAVLGPDFRLTRHRGEILNTAELVPDIDVVATIHPSAVLRASDRDDTYAGLVADPRVVARRLD